MLVCGRGIPHRGGSASSPRSAALVAAPLHFGVLREAAGHVERGPGRACTYPHGLVNSVQCVVLDVTVAMFDGSLTLADCTEGIPC